ncbi:MAG: tyrosine-type recombinase/integrase [Candidatus Dadabacteria bacterium]
MQKTTTVPLVPEFLKFISASQKGRRTKYPGKKLSKGTINQYKCVYKLLGEYETKYNTTLTLTLLRRNSLPLLKSQKKYWATFLKNFLSFLYNRKNYFDNYVSSVLKVIRCVFNYLVQERNLPIGNFHNQFKIPCKDTSPLALEPAQLRFLIVSKDFENALPAHLVRTKDLFVFGCSVALRFSDLMRLKKSDVINSPCGAYLIVYTQKTGTEVRLPLPGYLIDIINKYKSSVRRYLLPRLSLTNFDLQVKTLCQKAGWDYVVRKIRYKQGKAIERTHKGRSFCFAEQVSSHTMRRTAITTLLILGTPEMIVRRLSGHSAGSREFYRYVMVAQHYLDKEVKQAFIRLIRDIGYEI